MLTSSRINTCGGLAGPFCQIPERVFAKPFALNKTFWEVGQGSFAHLPSSILSLIALFSPRSLGWAPLVFTSLLVNVTSSVPSEGGQRLSTIPGHWIVTGGWFWTIDSCCLTQGGNGNGPVQKCGIFWILKTKNGMTMNFNFVFL